MIKLLASGALCALFCSGAVAQQAPKPQAAQPSAGAQPELNKLLDTETSIFGQYHLVPIIVPEGEQVGDIMDVSNATMIAGADDCFPGLKPRQGYSQLPAITISSEKELAAALGVGDAVNVSGDVHAGQNFILDFTDVRLQKVSLAQLHSVIKKNVPECDTVRPFIDASYVPHPPSRGTAQGGKGEIPNAKAAVVAEKPPPLVIGMVFTARRVVHISTSETTNAGAQVSFPEDLMRRLHLTSFKVSGEGKNNNSHMVDLVGEQSVPVAFAPAFVVTAAQKFGQNQTSYDVAILDPDVLQSEIQLARREENHSYATVEQALKQNTDQYVSMFINESSKAPSMVVTRNPPAVAAFRPTTKEDALKSVFRLDGGV